jgi:VanZ family protein
MFLRYWLPPLAWGGVVIALSGELGSSQNSLGILKWLLSWLPLTPAQLYLVHFYVRKIIGHGGGYGVLYFLWFRAFQADLGYRPGRAFLYSLGLCFGLSLLDEGHQTMFTSRSGSLWDVALDLAGATVTALLARVFWTPRIGPPAGKDNFPDPSLGT